MIDYIQTNTTSKPRKIRVILDEKESACDTIKYPFTWDFIHLKEDLIFLVQNLGAFIFGSLVSKNTQSKKTFKKLFTEARSFVFDVNLKPTHYQIDALKK